MSPSTSALAQIAAGPQSDHSTLARLDGEVSGLALRSWADLLTRRFGPAAVAAVRDAAGMDRAALPDAPLRGAWYPVAAQLRVTRAALDLFLGGDLKALATLLEAETAGTIDRAKRRLLQLTVRPTTALKTTPRIYAGLYRPGAASATVSSREAEVRWTGAAFQREPLWRALQVVALGAMFETLGRPDAQIALLPDGETGFGVRASW